MTAEELTRLTGSADGYFEVHIDGDRWRELSAGIREGALATAVTDIAALLERTPELTREDELHAVCEQALHLARAPEITPGAPVLVSEEVSGIGRRSWQLPTESPPHYAPRAERLLARYLTPGTPRLNRG